MSKYIDNRNKKLITEDTQITQLLCLKEDQLLKDKFIEVLTYFIFDGTGTGYSKCKANSIITYKNDKITFIKCANNEEKKRILNPFSIHSGYL